MSVHAANSSSVGCISKISPLGPVEGAEEGGYGKAYVLYPQSVGRLL